MARRVFFSFHFGNDVNRSNVVRNSWVVQGIDKAGFIDKAAFEQIKLHGQHAVERWIDDQLKGTSVTVVLIGSETLERYFVQYEICESLKRGNGIIGVHINYIQDMVTKRLSNRGNTHTIIGHNYKNQPLYFDEICDGIYDYTRDNGFLHLGEWIEQAAKKHGK